MYTKCVKILVFYLILEQILCQYDIEGGGYNVGPGGSPFDDPMNYADEVPEPPKKKRRRKKKKPVVEPVVEPDDDNGWEGIGGGGKFKAKLINDGITIVHLSKSEAFFEGSMAVDKISATEAKRAFAAGAYSSVNKPKSATNRGIQSYASSDLDDALNGHSGIAVSGKYNRGYDGQVGIKFDPEIIGQGADYVAKKAYAAAKAAWEEAGRRLEEAARRVYHAGGVIIDNLPRISANVRISSNNYRDDDRYLLMPK